MPYRSRLSRLLLRSLLGGCALASCGVAGAATVAGMYEAVVPPPSRDERAPALTVALRQVAVRASGMRAAERIDDRVEWQLREVRPDGTVRIGFDRVTVEKLLVKHNLPIWGRERPATLVWMRGGDGQWLSASSSGPERDAIERVAQARGLPLIWPAMDAADLDFAASLAPGRSASQLMAGAARYRADAVLVGVANEAGGMQFSFAYDEVVTGQAGSLEDSVHLAADRCAKALAVPANARADVNVRVSGVTGLDAYARTLNYFEDLSIVRAVSIERLQADVIDIRLDVRGDAGVLRKTIAIDRRLAADAAADGALVYRVQN